MAAYTDAQKIANHLGVALTPGQATQADVVALAVTVWIDHRTGRSWQAVSGTVADEIQPVVEQTVWLAHPPVTAVSEVELRPKLGAWTVLDPSAYALVDPAAGKLELPAATNEDEARVDYTTATTAPPADLAYAATVLSAEVLYTALHPESAGVDSIAVGQNDISIRYTSGADAEKTSGASMAVRIVDAYRRVVVA